ncbi:MAG: hypothetical protein ACF8MJ_06695 [Phycisphaerales bacterium JB050]
MKVRSRWTAHAASVADEQVHDDNGEFSLEVHDGVRAEHAGGTGQRVGEATLWATTVAARRSSGRGRCAGWWRGHRAYRRVSQTGEFGIGHWQLELGHERTGRG